MILETADMLTTWLNGPRGINYQIPLVGKAQPTDAAPSLINGVLNALRDRSILNRQHPGVYPFVVVDVQGPITLDSGSSGVPTGLSQNVRVDIIAFVKSADQAIAIQQLSGTQAAIVKSLEQYEHGFGFATAGYRYLNDVMVLARTDLAYIPFESGIEANTIGSMTSATYQVRVKTR